MPAILNATDDSGRLQLAGQLDFSSVAGLRSSLSPFLKKGSRLEIDLKAVDRTNSAALALLLQWQQDALDRNCRINFINLPEKLIDIAELHGIKGLLPIS
jgi:phospholipid transport system transporter-binding protein